MFDFLLAKQACLQMPSFAVLPYNLNRCKGWCWWSFPLEICVVVDVVIGGGGSCCCCSVITTIIIMPQELIVASLSIDLNSAEKYSFGNH
jgi:hypothetical protein